MDIEQSISSKSITADQDVINFDEHVNKILENEMSTENGILDCDTLLLNWNQSDKSTLLECSVSDEVYESKPQFDHHLKLIHQRDLTYPIGTNIESMQNQIDEKDTQKEKNFNKPDDNSLYTCTLCSKSFSRKYNLKMHLNVHLKVKLHTCDICGKQFSHLSNFVKHQRIHLGIKPYLCRVCNRRFTQIQALKAHQTCHSNISCLDCDLQLTSLPSLIRHMKFIHSKHYTFKEASKTFIKEEDSFSRHFYCTLCGESYKSKLELSLHKKKDHNNKKCCQICFKTFQNSTYFNDHQCSFNKNETKEDIETIECYDACNFNSDISERENLTLVCNMQNDSSFSSDVLSQTLNSEIDNQDKLTNEPCTVICNNSSKIKSGSKHSKRTKKCLDKIDRVEVALSCGECGKQFNKHWNYNQHIATHNPSLRRYICEFCQLTFSYHSTLKRHLLKHAPDQFFTCNLCSKQYLSKDSLLIHKKKFHSRKINYYCEVCKKGFFNKPEYDYHLRIHSKDRPFLCPTCGKRFSHTSHLHRHEKLHTSEKNHKCPKCSKAYIQKSSLRAHLRTHKDSEGVSRCDKDSSSIEQASKDNSLPLDPFALDSLENLDCQDYFKSNREMISLSLNNSAESILPQSSDYKESPEQLPIRETESGNLSDFASFSDDGCVCFLKID